MSTVHSADMECNTKEESSDDDLIEEYDLEQDTFSFLFVANVFSLSFVVGVTIYVMEVAILILFIINELKQNNATDINPLGVPVWVDGDVRGGQFIAILVTLLMSSDLVTSLDIFYVPYDKETEKAFPDATRYRWYISNFCRFTADLLIVAISFIIIVQSSSNLALFQNFAAISFVSSLDDATFALISSGFGSRDSTALATKIVESLKFKYKSKDKKHELLVKNGGLFTIFLILVVGYAGVFLNQAKGYYFNDYCQLLEVKFTDKKYDFFRSNFNKVCEEDAFDEADETLCPGNWQDRSYENTDGATFLNYLSFNGVYEIQKNEGGGADYEMYNHRPVYVQRGRDGLDAFGKDSPPGRFMYCGGSWVFSIPGVHKGKIDFDENVVGDVVEDNCHWLLKSPKTKAYDLTGVSLTNWIVWTGRLEVADGFSMNCIECKKKSTKLVADCSYNGICNEEKRCECEADFMGAQCETCICDTLSTTWDGGVWTYHRVDGNDGPLTVYGRAVYLLKEIDSKPASENINVVTTFGTGVSQLLMYTGYDYVFINVKFDSDEEMKNYLHLFHSGWDYDYVNQTSFISERTDLPMPSGLTWYRFHPNGTRTEADFDMSCSSGACYVSSNFV